MKGLKGRKGLAYSSSRAQTEPLGELELAAPGTQPKLPLAGSLPMNAYLFTAGVTRTQHDSSRGLQTWDTCMSAVMFGEDSEQAQKLDEVVALSPEMREKEAVVLVEARNSVVAGWLWRKFSADTPLAQNEIHVSQCCPIFSEE